MRRRGARNARHRPQMLLSTTKGELHSSHETRHAHEIRLIYFFALALGPHPQRELTLTPSRGRLGVAAGAFALALGPHPQRELTLTPSRGRLGVAAGAFALPPGPHPQRH